MQFLWWHVNYLVGAGLDLVTLLKFCFYASCYVLPNAMPIAILLSSLITFGNLGEDVELTAIKAGGVSLFRVMTPLIFTVMMVSAGSLYFTNFLQPSMTFKLWRMLDDIKHAKPELDIPVGEFYSNLTGYNLYVRDRNDETGVMYDVMIYDYSQGFESMSVTQADSARLMFSEDGKFLALDLYYGECFENLSSSDRQATGSPSGKNIPYRRETFSYKRLLLDVKQDVDRMSQAYLKDQQGGKNFTELKYSIDSVNGLFDQRAKQETTDRVTKTYFARDQHPEWKLKDLETGDAEIYDVDSLFASLAWERQQRVFRVAVEKAQNEQDRVNYSTLLLKDHLLYIRKHEVELYRKFTLAFACLVFFFIGAPLGAIVRKGGLGFPVVVSVAFYMIYYMVDTFGFKMARESVWPVWMGASLSSVILLIIGILLTVVATLDSPLFSKEWWIRIGLRLQRYLPGKLFRLRRSERKDK